jgi:hypothetical protein
VKIAAALLALLALTACGGRKSPSAEEVVRAWSAALDQNDNEHAARLFAHGARIIQNGELILTTHADAVRWNAGLPCGGRISALEVHGRDEVLAVFDLGARPQHRCDGIGRQAAALFQVEHGEIVLWHQIVCPSASRPGRRSDLDRGPLQDSEHEQRERDERAQHDDQCRCTSTHRCPPSRF